MILLHDPNHVRYGFEANPAYPQGWLRKLPPQEFAPLKELSHKSVLDRLHELFEGATPHPQGEYTLYLDLTDSPTSVRLTLLHGLCAELDLDLHKDRLVVRMSQFVQMYPPTKRTQGHWKGSTFEKDLNILSRKILQEYLLDLEVRGIWRMWNQDLDKEQPLPEQVARKRSLPRTIARPRSLASGTEIRLTDLTGSKT